MRIECVLKRVHPQTKQVGTEVSFDQWPTVGGAFDDKPATPAATYFFKPLDPSDANSPHVADIEHEAHVFRLLECNGAFRIFDAAPTRPSVPAPAAAAQAKTESSSADRQSDAAAKAAFEAEVKQVRETPVKDLKRIINTIPREVLAAALEAEKAEGGKAKGFVEVVSAHLGTLPSV